MNIYLVRHGETDWNVEKRIQGQSDVSLNHNGLYQAMNSVKYFDQLKFDKVYTSSLSRAIQTAEIITRGKYNLIKCPNLNERHFGDWQKRLWSEVHEENPNLNKIWKKEGLLYKPKNGESLQELYVRSVKKFEDILQFDKSFKNILIVAHGGPLKAIIGSIKGTDPNDIHNGQGLSNCSITKVIFENGKLNLAFENYLSRNSL
ncbi:MAG: histidine phosphatase family protein [bacterium]